MPIESKMAKGKNWPPNYLAEFARRESLLDDLETDLELRQDFLTHYKHNPIDWITDWGITFDPRNKDPLPKVMPFMMFQKQRDFIEFLLPCLNDNESGIVEKARDMGASWLCVAFSTWLWLFHDGSAIGWGSRKEEYVDKKGDPKAIFPKIRQQLEYLPHWMLPKGFGMDTHATYMKIINPENGATITGEAGDNIGRGGRTSIYFKDESAHYEHPESIEAALGDNTDVQIDISSVNGSANVFYRRRMAAEMWEQGKVIARGMVRLFIFDWRDHPGKTQEWYDARYRKAEREGLMHVLAQEVDRDYTSSVDRVIIESKWVRAALDAHIKLGFGAGGEKTAGQDVADEGGDKNALAIRHGVILQYVDHWAGDPGEAANIAVPKCIEYQVNELYYDSIGVGAGFKVGINNLKKMQAFNPKTLRIYPWNAGAKVLDPEEHLIPNDDQSPTNEDFFENLKAQAWWKLRTRFYKTWRCITYGEVYNSNELISLPSQMPKVQELMMELSQAIHKYSKSGKTMVDKKPDDARSPNLADAVVMCYCPVREISIFDVL
jgi:phage terminase large subunit